MASADRALPVALRTDATGRRSMAGAPIIAAESVSKRFGTNQVLTRVSLAVSEREVVCVVGPSGSGKTTLLRCLALLEEPSEGRVDHARQRDRQARRGRRGAGARRASVRPDIGMVFQHFNLWPHMSVLENVIEAPMRVKEHAEGRGGRHRPSSCWTRSASPTSATPIRRASRAGSSSASPSPARSPCRRR